MKNSNFKVRILSLSPIAGLNKLLLQLPVPPRFRSAILDHFAMVIVYVILGSPILIYHVILTVRAGRPSDIGTQLGPLIYFALLNSLYVNKDALNGQSLGKIASNLYVKDLSSHLTASPFKCLLRNVFIVIWPLDLLVLILTGNRRLGDFVANTQVSPNDDDAYVKFSPIKFVLCVIGGTIFFLAIFMFFIN